MQNKCRSEVNGHKLRHHSVFISIRQVEPAAAVLKHWFYQEKPLFHKGYIVLERIKETMDSLGDLIPR